jgi:hypothetical protein
MGPLDPSGTGRGGIGWAEAVAVGAAVAVADGAGLAAAAGALAAEVSGARFGGSASQPAAHTNATTAPHVKARIPRF